MSSLTFSTLNVRGILDIRKRNKYITWLQTQKIDVAFLQETYCTLNHVDKIKQSCKEHGFRSYHALTDSSHSRGVAILISNKIECTIRKIKDDNNGRTLLLNVMIEGISINLINIYAPNRAHERSAFFQNVSAFIEEHRDPDGDIICAGDFNCTLRDIDRISNNIYSDKSVETLKKRIIDNFSLNDIWQRNKNKDGYTFYNKNGSKSRLDFFLVTSNPKFIVKKSYIMQTFKADHRCVLMNVKLLKNKRGKGYWKLNNSLLEDREYCKRISECIDWVKNQYSYLQSKRIFWEILKHFIKKTSIGYSVTKSKKKKNEKEKLQSEIDQLNGAIEMCSNNVVKEMLQQTKTFKENILNKLYEEHINGYFVRSRAEFMEQGERSTRYFLSLEKARQNSNVIRVVKSDRGNLYSDKEILEEASSFYKKLYSEDNIEQINIDNFLNDLNVGNTLTETEKSYCEKDISIDELRDAVKNLKLNKSPGSDGLTPDFYKKFWPNLEVIFYGVTLEIFDNGELCESMKKSILSLLFKKGNRELLENYRPLSLGNYDYKILAHVIASRIQKIIKNLVNPDQSAYIKGRFIGNNARFLLDLIEWAESQKNNGLIICIDFKKAFDSLNWDFMFSVLKYFNFGTKFINIIKTMYNDPKLTIKNNGHFSNEIQLRRGIRQGCPASALLFTLCVEFLWKAVDQNRDINAIKIDNRQCQKSRQIYKMF